MKVSAHKFGMVAALLAFSFVGRAAPAKATNSVPKMPVHSAFDIPKAPKEGRDPFFPKATSLYQTEGSKPVVDSGIDLLKLKGILGTSYATINNVTLGIGETEEVKTLAGPISVRLIEIKAQDESVVIEANGQRRVLSSGGGLTHK